MKNQICVILGLVGIASLTVLVACGGGGAQPSSAEASEVTRSLKDEKASADVSEEMGIKPGVKEGIADFGQVDPDEDKGNFMKRAMAQLEDEADPTIDQLQGGVLLKVDKPVYTEPPEMQIDVTKKYTATVEMRYKGSIVAAFGKKDLIVIELFAKEAPVTVNSFVFLARNKFYDGLSFHRIIPGFMAQGGDPNGDGTGGPGYTFDDEFSASLTHDGPGVVSMANAGIKDGNGTNGSQFFITYSAQPLLDGLNADGSPKNCADQEISCHTVFGKVVEGMELIEKFAARDPSVATDEPITVRSGLAEVIRTIIITEE